MITTANQATLKLNQLQSQKITKNDLLILSEIKINYPLCTILQT